METTSGEGFWPKLGRGLGVAATAVGRAAAGAYHSVDPDARRHVAELPLAGLTLIAKREVDVAALPDDGHRPVVFVHGLGGGRGNFTLMRLWLRLQGRRRTYSLRLPGSESIPRLAERLSAYVHSVIEANDLAEGQVDLVAHSMGGLVARCALEDPETARRVATLVTLGTPHAGSHAARYADTQHTRDLRPDSELLARLARQLPWSGSSRLVCFWSRADVILLPATTARVEGATNVELPDVTHYGYLIYPSVWQRVNETLRG